MSTMDMVGVSAIASQAGYTQEDADVVAARLPEWLVTPDGVALYTVDSETGETYVPQRREHFVTGFLYGAAERRREERVTVADERLVAAYDALKSHPKMPKAATDQPAWQSQMLRLFAGVTDALGELLDAKLDAKAINPTRAARIRSEAISLRDTAERNVQAALRKALRMARSH